MNMMDLALKIGDSPVTLQAKLLLQDRLATGAFSPERVEGMLATLFVSEQIRRRNGAGETLH